MLIVNVEGERDQADYHSVFVKNEAQARQLYQIVLEVSIDRLIKKAIIAGGIYSWSEADPGKIRDMLMPHMNRIVGEFHAPEEHLSGNGPLQILYNAKVATSILRLENTHIYFAK